VSDFDLPEMRRIHWAQALPIEREALNATAEILELEESFKDDINCAGADAAHGSNGCTIEVTHIANGCSKHDVPVCESLVTFKRSRIAIGAQCTKCLRLAGDCWSYRPI
jgi:hypothetical protein